MSGSKLVRGAKEYLKFYRSNSIKIMSVIQGSSAILLPFLPRMTVDPVIFLFPALEHVSITSLHTKLTVMSATFLFFLAIFILSYIGSYLLVASFATKLRPKEKVFWCLAFIRGVYGFSATFVGLWFLFVDDIVRQDIATASNFTSYMAVYVSVGFFLFECVALLSSNVYFRFFDPFLFAHHLISLAGVGLEAVYDGKGHFFGTVGLLLEMSTPFSCICWMLLKCGMADHWIWKANQLVLVHLFHCRTTLECYVYYKCISQWENMRDNMPAILSLVILLQLHLVLFLLTPYWTYKKMAQMFNPVDWNHPEPVTASSNSDSATNDPVNVATSGVVEANGTVPTNDFVPIVPEKKRTTRKRRKNKKSTVSPPM